MTTIAPTSALWTTPVTRTCARLLGASLLLLAAPACTEVVVAPEPVDRGVVRVFQSDAEPSPWVGAYVQFLGHVVYPCTTLDTEGACRLVGCTVGGGSAPGTFAYVDAGTVTIAGSLGEVAVPFEGNTYGPGLLKGSAVFATGDLLKIDVAGSGAVSPIAATLPIPPPPVVTSAPFGDVVDRSQPLVITWESDAPEGRMHAWIDTHSAQTAPGSVRLSIDCAADLSLGQLEMPPALLSQLTTGPQDAPEIVVSYGAYEEIEHEGWRLALSAEAMPRRPDGSFVTSHAVTLK